MVLRTFTAAAVLAITLVGCGGGQAAPDVPNPVKGLITEVGDDHIVLKTEDGKRITFDNADTEIGVVHLEEHRKQKLPVQVTHEPNGARLIARRIEDAPSGS